MPLAHRAVIGLVMLITLGGVIALTRFAAQPAYAVLFSDLDSKDASAIVAIIRDQKIPYRLRTGGSTIEVDRDQVDELRMTLAAKQLPSGSSASLDSITKNPLLSDPFVQKVEYQRGLAGELERALKTLDGVVDAKVILSLPEKRLFKEDEQSPSASISLQFAAGFTPTSRQRAAMVHLVSYAVPGLTPEHVALVDRDGRGLLNGGQAGLSGIQADQLAYQDELERRIERQLLSLVEGALGPGKVRLRVSADVDFDQVTTETVSHTPASVGGQPVVINEQSSDSSYTGNVKSITGAPGVDSNLRLDAGGGASNTPSGEGYKTTSKTVTNAVNEEHTSTRKAPGAIKRLSVAVFVDNTVPVADLNALKTVLQAAAGIDVRSAPQGRGDVIEVMPIAFQKPDTAKADKAAKAAAASAQRNAMIRTGAAVLIMIIFAVIVLIALRRRPTIVAPALTRAGGSPGAAGPRARVTEVPMQSPAPPGGRQAPAATGASPAALTVAEETPVDLTLPAEGEEAAYAQAMAEQRPEEVAKLVRSWMAESGR